MLLAVTYLSIFTFYSYLLDHSDQIYKIDGKDLYDIHRGLIHGETHSTIDDR